MKFALITADSHHNVSFKTNPARGDATSFMQWVSVLDGVHFSFSELRKEDNSYLKEFDVVMFSGDLKYIEDIIRIGKFLKGTRTVTIFYPEGSAQLYDNSINGFHPEYYEAWRACDVVSIAEEGKDGYYNSFIDQKNTLVRFIHVPITDDMDKGVFFKMRGMKLNYSVVYGDNNPNHPMIAFSCINILNKIMRGKINDFYAIAIETRNADIGRIFPDIPLQKTGKMDSYDFMNILSTSFLHFYPTEWIGTARQPIACAAVGTPCVGSNLSHTQRRLWPDLCFDPYDVTGMVSAAERLIMDGDFYLDCVNYAFKKMSHYSMANTKLRFFKAVEDSIKLKNLNLSEVTV